MHKGYEVAVMKKYKKGRVLAPEDRLVIDGLCSMGHATLGLKTNCAIPADTAKITSEGRKQLFEEITRRSWFLVRLFRNLWRDLCFS